jgi:hypothetical protein
MTPQNRFRRSIATGAIALAALAGQSAYADEAPGTPVLAALDASNPNYTEWSLINLTASDVTSANGGAGVKVAVLDGLTDCRHNDLTGRCSYNLISGGTYRYYSNHGTHTAGIVAGSKFGIATSATVINYAVFDDRTYVANGSKLVSAWRSAYSAGARISSMSFGCAKMALCFTASEVSAMADSTRPMLYVKAAGNDGAQLVRESILVSSATANTALARTLLVGSVNASGGLSTFSNTPGENCLLASGNTTCSESLKWKNHFLVAPGEAIYSTMPGNSYAYMSGTSMATPVVAGVAALLQQRWPALKNTPETLAKILLTTATDIGTPGVDAVYGYGLLNAAAAFRANGAVTIQSPSGGSTTVTNTTTTTSPMLRNFRSVLSAVTVYDQFGRDFALSETNDLQVAPNAIAVRQFLGRRLLASTGQEDWTAGFFADEPQARGFAMMSSAAEAPGSLLALDRTTRMGVDMPFKGGLAQLRLTGAGDARQDLAHDETMRPLAYFASSGLLRGALIGNAAISLPGRGRLMVYGMATTGAMNPRYDGNPLELRLSERGYTPRAALIREPAARSQSGFGLGYWRQTGARTVIGVNASAMIQRGGYYSLTSDLSDFQRPTKLFNFGGAVIRRQGDWELSLSGEMTHLRMNSGDASLSFTPATLASGEISVSKNRVAFASGDLRDSLALSLAIPPRAVAGSLRVNYLTPTADGMDRQAAMLLVPLAALGREPMRVEAAYRLRSGTQWTLSISGGANLEQVPGLAAGEGMVTFRLSI